MPEIDNEMESGMARTYSPDFEEPTPISPLGGEHAIAGLIVGYKALQTLSSGVKSTAVGYAPARAESVELPQPFSPLARTANTPAALSPGASRPAYAEEVQDR